MKKLKKKILILSLLPILFFPNCAQKSINMTDVTYHLSKGTPLRKNFPNDFKKEYPILTISHGKQTTKFKLPLGTTVWQNKSNFGFLVLKYMDKRFAAFGSDAFLFVDLTENKMFTIVTDVIFEEDNKFNSAPTLKDRMVFVFSSDDCLYALNAANGKLVWKRKHKHTCGFPLVYRDLVYVSTLKSIHAMDSRTGEERWSLAGQYNEEFDLSPCMGKDLLYVGGSNHGFILALRPDNGEIV